MLLALAVSLTASSQTYQFADPGFDGWTGSTTPYNEWNSFEGAEGSMSSFKKSSPAPSRETPGYDGAGFCIKIFSNDLWIAKANGNLTTGVIMMGNTKPTDASNHNKSKISDSEKCMAFDGRPDAVSFYAKFTSGGSPNGRGMFILHDAVDYQDPEISSQAGNKVGSASVLVPASSDWVRYEGAFTYQKEQPSQQYLLASFTTNPTPGGSAGDELFIDEVRFIYYHALSALSYEGATINFNEATTSYDLSDVEYEAAKLSYTKKGQGATVTTSYNEETAVLTIRVEGDDYNASTNADAYTEYTVQFKTPAPLTNVTGIKISGETFAAFNPETEAYTLPYAYHPGILLEAEAEEGTGVTVEYDNEAQTITVVDGDRRYVFSFTAPVQGTLSGDYPGGISVVLTTADGASTPMVIQNGAVALTMNSNGTANLTLNDFSFMGMVVGDIFVSNLPVNGLNLEGRRTLRITDFLEDGTPNEGALGGMLGSLPVVVNLQVLSSEEGKLAAEGGIDIITTDGMLGAMFQNIHVDFTGYTVEASEVQSAEDGFGRQYYNFVKANGFVTKNSARFLQLNNSYTNLDDVLIDNPMLYVDLSEAEIGEDVTLEDVMANAPAANNTLLFVPATAAISGDNVVKGETAAVLRLNNEAPFCTPKAFTASSVSLDYDFTTGDKALQGFVMPFSAPAASVNGKVYAFDGVENGRINLLSVETMSANTPYFLRGASSANPFSALTDVAVTPVSEGMSELNVQKDDYTLYGTLEGFTLADTEIILAYDAGTEMFGASEFTNARPFSAVLMSANESSLGLRLDGVDTAIETINLTDESASVNVYTLDGRLVRRAVAPARALEGLGNGIYVVNGKKTIK